MTKSMSETHKNNKTRIYQPTKAWNQRRGITARKRHTGISFSSEVIGGSNSEGKSIVEMVGRQFSFLTTSHDHIQPIYTVLLRSKQNFKVTRKWEFTSRELKLHSRGVSLNWDWIRPKIPQMPFIEISESSERPLDSFNISVQRTVYFLTQSITEPNPNLHTYCAHG